MTPKQMYGIFWEGIQMVNGLGRIIRLNKCMVVFDKKWGVAPPGSPLDPPLVNVLGKLFNISPLYLGRHRDDPF